jgi:hypothetical protein
MAAIWHVLLWFRPGGDSGLRQITMSSGTAQADQLIDEIRSADLALPITRGSARQHTMARLKENLGGRLGYGAKSLRRFSQTKASGTNEHFTSS